MIEKLIEIRDLTPDMRNFVLNSWLRSLRASDCFYRRIDANIFFDNHETLITKCLERTSVLVATPADHPSLVIGYIVFDDQGFSDSVTVHYCYVKSDYRKMGIATLLFDHVSKDRHVILTHDAGELPNTTYNPYEFWRQDGRDEKEDRIKEAKYN